MSNPQTEAEIVTDMIAALKEQVADPFCDDVEQAKALLASAESRLVLLQQSLQEGESITDSNGKAYTLNSAGFGEPDITTPNPGDRVLERIDPITAPARARQASKAVDSKPLDASDFDQVVQQAACLGIDANTVHALWSEIQTDLGEREFDRMGYWALKQAVMNHRLLKYVHDMESLAYKLSGELAKSKKV